VRDGPGRDDGQDVFIDYLRDCSSLDIECRMGQRIRSEITPSQNNQIACGLFCVRE
jgi:hypothetical protein